MTKENLKKELLEKVKLGTKPSDLKPLKRSKSADDIPNQPPSPLLQAQLTEKQRELESLRKQGEDSAKQIEALNQQLTETKQELDNSLQARIQGVKTFGSEHDKRVKAQQELNETIEEASQELVSTDKQVSSLRVKLTNAQQEINKLRNELNLARIKRNSVHPELTSPNDNFLTNLKYALYALLTV